MWQGTFRWGEMPKMAKGSSDDSLPWVGARLAIAFSARWRTEMSQRKYDPLAERDARREPRAAK
jgi:hypothetical protein